jgi:hypothetical protein
MSCSPSNTALGLRPINFTLEQQWQCQYCSRIEAESDSPYIGIRVCGSGSLSSLLIGCGDGKREYKWYVNLNSFLLVPWCHPILFVRGCVRVNAD